MPKIKPFSGKNVIKARTVQTPDGIKFDDYRWWEASSKKELCAKLFAVVNYLKKNQNWRQYQAAYYERLYSNLPTNNALGSSLTKINPQFKFASDRSTYNAIASCVDALTSKITQSRPKPMFVTFEGSTKKQKQAKDLNRFIDGELYQTKAYEKGGNMFRDACTVGDGVLHIVRENDRVCVERTMATEIFVDEMDGEYGEPRQLHKLKLVDRDVAAKKWPSKTSAIMKSSRAFFDRSAESQNSISNQIMLVESWHLPSAKGAKDGLHTVACEADTLFDETWEEDDYPFVKFPYAPRARGYWAAGIPERTMGLQNEINRLLYSVQIGLYLCAVPKWLIEDGSKVISAHINNGIGTQIKYQGTRPELAINGAFPPEVYNQIEALIQRVFTQEGISQLYASATKPPGLNSGEGIREYNDLQSDRFASLSTRYEDAYTELSKKIFREAKKIAKETGKYETIYPGKRGLERIDLAKLEFDPDDFIIRQSPVSALKDDVPERTQQVLEWGQIGLIDQDEMRRLADFPDLEAETSLANAPRNRILKVLDSIVEDGKYEAPDGTMNLQMAGLLALQYYNKFVTTDLEPKKLNLLLTFKAQVEALGQQAASAQAAMQAQAMQAQGAPQSAVANLQGEAPQALAA